MEPRRATRPVDWDRLRQALKNLEPLTFAGRVKEAVGLVITSQGPASALGGVCLVERPRPLLPIPAEVVGFREGRVLLMPYGEVRGIRPQARVTLQGLRSTVPVGQGLLGRVIDALGRPLDGKGPISPESHYPLYVSPQNPCTRRPITEPLDVGIRAINGLLTLGKGQRIGIFSGSGVGKSTLMGMIARHTRGEVNVIGLVGERGREVAEFIKRHLGDEGLARSCVVAATSDSPPLLRLRGAYVATAVAEYFRDQGRDVILMLDSVTRFAMAAREIGLALGEPPTARGYTPSVFARLPALLERAGTHDGPGTISGIYTILVEGDDLLEPISDTMRATLDGHIVLSRELADQGQYPAIDVLGSISRLMVQITHPEHLSHRERLIRVVSAYRRAEDLININAYVRGSNPEIDYALEKVERVNRYLHQGIDEAVSLPQATRELAEIFAP